MAGDTSGSAEDALRIQVLGGFRVVISTRELDESAWRLRKASALVKLLALTPGHRLHRERVMDALWPELSPEAGSNTLHRTLHAARRVLEPARPPGTPVRYLTLRGDLISLAPAGALVVDADCFREAAVTATRTRDSAAYRQAIALYRGDLLPNDPYDDWAVAAREELREQYVALLTEAARHFVAHGAPNEAIETLRLLVGAEPTREDAHVALMRLLALGGRRYDALRQYQQLRAHLRTELAVEPETATQQLYAAIEAGTFPTRHTSVSAAPAQARAAGMAAAAPPGAAHATYDRDAASRSAAPADQPTAAAGTLDGHATSFIGRVREQEELRGLLAAHRLVTVVGPGGSGKTRLALHTAESLRDSYAGGIALVELVALTNSTLVPQAAALALGIREQAERPLIETLVAALTSRHLLLILDNCEHIREACAELACHLLQACPEVRILATSRSPLRLAGETVWRLQTLAAPDPDALPPFARLLNFDAIRLFVERAAASRHGFALTPQNAPAVVRICHRLDGLPLAIELAAGRRRVLSVEQIAARLDDALALLGGGPDEVPRQATVRATIAWSWEMLSAPERTLLRRVAVFAGGWMLDAAEAICTDETDEAAAPGTDAGARSPGPPQGERSALGTDDTSVLDLLARLVERSLVVVVERDDAVRYRLLETIRQYAAAQLRASDEEQAIRRRHALWLLRLVRQAASGLNGDEPEQWLARLDAENDNLRAALEWACSAGEVELAQRIAAHAARYWYMRGTVREGHQWLRRTLERDEALGRIAPLAVRARALQQYGLLAQFQLDLERAEAACEESLRLWRELGNLRGMDESLSVLAGSAESRGDYVRAARLYSECLELARQQDDPTRVTLGLSNLADQLVLLGDLARARDLYAESRALAERTGIRRYQAMALANLGRTALLQGDAASAEPLLESSLRIMRALGIPRGAGEALLPLGQLALAQGAVELAQKRYREALGEYRRSDSWLGVAQALDGLSHALAVGQQAERAAEMLGVADALRERLGTPRTPAEQTRHEGHSAALRATLGDEALAAALAHGRALPVEQVVATLCTAETPRMDVTEARRGASLPAPLEPPSRPRADRGTAATLTARERQVAELVAAGLTNREIAARLQIALRTADTHVANLLAKLELRSRAEVGSWLRAHLRAD